jgi:hypothetical protein
MHSGPCGRFWRLGFLLAGLGVRIPGVAELAAWRCRVKRWIFLVFGVLLVIVGVVWILQGLNVLGQSGGMNGQGIWAVIGLAAAAAGLGCLAIGARAWRAAGNPPATQ